MNLSENDIIARIGYFRNKRNLSQRELSLRLDYSETWCYRVEKGEINLRIKNILDITNALEITLEEFLYYDINKYGEDKTLLQLIKTMSKEEKDALVNFIKIKK